MAKIRYARMKVTKNAMMTVTAKVPQWEAHVLQALWGEDAQIVETYEVDGALPEAGDEFTRLANKYGPRDEDIPMVAKVYGSFGPGIRSLEREFAASIVRPGEAAASTVTSEMSTEIAKANEQLAEDERIAAEAQAAINGAGNPVDEELPNAETSIRERLASILPGNTVEGRPLETIVEEGKTEPFLEAGFDVSDLTGEGGSLQVE